MVYKQVRHRCAHLDASIYPVRAHPEIVMAGQISVAQQRQRLRSKRAPGKGLLDWIKLCRSFKQQTANQTQIVSFEELRKHNTEEDCWTAFRGEFKATDLCNDTT